MPCPKRYGRLGCTACGVTDVPMASCPRCGQEYCQTHADTMDGCTFDRAAVEAAFKTETDPAA